MKKISFGLFALISYSIGMGSLLYLCGFMVNQVVPKGIDQGIVDPTGQSLLINGAILLAFLAPHSIMARPAFKDWWTTILPRPLERAFYILFTGVTLLTALWFWQPIPVIIWSVQTNAFLWAIYAIYATGWVIIVVSTFTIDHFLLFGLRQAWDFIRNATPKPERFTATWFYALVRHPISAGWMIVFWATPNMTLGHLEFAVGMVVYILIVTPIEERDLEDSLGDDYRNYKQRVRGFVPVPKTRGKLQSRRST